MEPEQAMELIDEALGCVGMIAEAKTKCHLWRGRLRKVKKLHNPYSEEYAVAYREGSMAVRQIKSDFRKYSRRILEIDRELRLHGIIQDLA